MSVIPLQGSSSTLIIGLGILLIIVVVSQSVEIVKPHEKNVLTVFGEYRKVLEPGVNFVVPFVSRTHPVNILIQQLDIPQQTVTARDGVPVTADAKVFFRVTDAKQVFLEVDDYKRSVSDLVQTTMREAIGDMDFGDVEFDDMDPDERDTLWEEIRTRIENEYEVRKNIDPNDRSIENWPEIQDEINDRTREKYVDIDDGLKQRMEISARITDRILKEIDRMTDEWGVNVLSVEVRNLNPNPGTQNEMGEAI